VQRDDRGSKRNMFMPTPAVVKEKIWVNTGGVGSCSRKRRLMSWNFIILSL
jgi:hypothetical protein